MSTVDRVLGDWYLKSINGNVYIDAANGQGSTTIRGNLIVIGNQTNVGSIETLISDNILTLAANVTSGQPILNAGIEVRRGNEPTVSVRWNETLDRWEVTNDGTLFRPLLDGVVTDINPFLGGNLNVNGYEIQSPNNQNIILRPGLNAGIEIKNTVGNVAPVAGSTMLYAKTPGTGQSGLYVSNSAVSDEELITKRKAIIYSLVL
jgi:hypothetical protein